MKAKAIVSHLSVACLNYSTVLEERWHIALVLFRTRHSVDCWRLNTSEIPMVSGPINWIALCIMLLNRWEYGLEKVHFKNSVHFVPLSPDSFLCFTLTSDFFHVKAFILDNSDISAKWTYILSVLRGPDIDWLTSSIIHLIDSISLMHPRWHACVCVYECAQRIKL